MSRSDPRSVFADDELVQMLIDEPELLALADAVKATQVAGPQLARSRRWPVVAAVAAAAVAGVAVALAAWPEAAPLTQQALAAVGADPVLHVVLEDPDAATESTFEIATGQPVARALRTEIWFDGERNLKKTIYALDRSVVDEQLETRAGGVTRTGPIYTCAWIARHRALAARRGLSCDAGAGEKTPAPSIEAAIAGFVDGYRQALASGAARDVGADHVVGRDVRWLQFRAENGLTRVAVDVDSHLPVALESADGRTQLRVLRTETLPFRPRLFSQPRHVEPPGGGSVISEAPTDLEGAAQALRAEPLWLGQRWNQLQLAEISRQRRSLSRGLRSPVATVQFTYTRTGAGASVGRGSELEIIEARQCVVRLGWACSARDPRDERTIVFPVGEGGPAIIRRGLLYISIWGAADRTEAIAVARALASDRRFAQPGVSVASPPAGFAPATPAKAGDPKAFSRAKTPADAVSHRLHPRWRIVDSRRVATYRDRRGRFAELYVAKTSDGQLCHVLSSDTGFGGGCSPARLFFRPGHRVSALSTRLFAGIAADEVTRVVLVGSRGKRHVPRLSPDGGFIYNCRAYNGCACLIAWLDAYNANGKRVSHENWLGSGCRTRR